ncbi:MAG: hypothetical protein ACD_51C00150G0004 [uncultured bacterium]|nr:MAG: hypothetical protein ACD_51C00150G0004 [uncultured bacterium]OGJ48181.1 MAG: hypothetical protein A2344_01070 [Candidatus Peregrinibacteria bacterium RIFOXYB12_FULL_41_12]OGJ48292.1 MAG: hypothetical protein A2244_02130 [Candidatus Peregrinibacteria bacterium RIFOXYA2_FULL_41_18]
MAIESGKITPEQERGITKAGHFWSFVQERYLPGKGNDIGNCSSKESAYVWALEEECMNIPEDLRFEQIAHAIPEEHRDRIGNVWKTVMRYRREWVDTGNTLKDCWENAPAECDPESEEILQWVSFKFRPELQKAVKGIIGYPDVTTESQNEHARSLAQWKTQEKSLRRFFYHADKNYLAAQRVYFDLLIEHTDDGKSVLPPDHEKRQAIALRIRKLRFVDSLHQGLSTAKAYHYKQKNSRLRDTKKEPYYVHPERVALAMAYDILPYVLEEETVNYTPENIGLIPPVHDCPEDTNASVESTIGFIEGHVDTYDSQLNFGSGFVTELDRKKGDKEGSGRIKRQTLNIVTTNMRRRIRRVLLALTNGTEKDMSMGLKKKVVERNLAGRARSFAIIGIQGEEAEKAFCVKNDLAWEAISEEPQSEIFRQMPPHSLKMDSFLVRMDAINSDDEENRQVALQIKLEDRADNMKDLHAKKIVSRLKTLRETVTRLIPAGLAEKDKMFNALPRLIDATLERYRAFSAECPDKIEDCDHTYITKLESWQLEVTRLELKDSVKAVVERWESAKAA